jgi:hypothetical protein
VTDEEEATPDGLRDLRNMGDVYQRWGAPTITDPRVKESWGGGMCPEQHWGRLQDGRGFYFRMRHACASLCLCSPEQDPVVDLPMVNPEWNKEDFDAAYVAGTGYPHRFFLDPRPDVEVYPDDSWIGSFKTDEDRQRTFTTLLDEILQVDDAVPTQQN